MPLVPITDLIARAEAEGYALGYFESWNFDSLQGAIDAAEQTRSPIIIGFNGEFMSHPDRIAQEPLSWYAALGRAAAESASVPVGFIFNECPDDGWVRRAVDAGFNLVMPVAAHDETTEAYTERVRLLVDYAHARGAAVEAELGVLPYGAEGELHGGSKTAADEAAAFIAATGADLLAVSVGNIHVLLEGQRDLDLAQVDAIHRAARVPLVLHGGTGISGESIRESIRLGVRKVNYGTYLKRHYLDAVRRALASPDPNPHHLLGYGGEADVLVAGRRAMCEAVLQRIDLLGCVGRA